MIVLCNKYCRFVIAVLLMTVLYGKSVTSMACKAFACESMSVEAEELTEDSESKAGKDSPFKKCKKSWTEMVSDEVLLPDYPFIGYYMATLTAVACADPLKHFQKVLTPPPLV